MTRYRLVVSIDHRNRHCRLVDQRDCLVTYIVFNFVFCLSLPVLWSHEVILFWFYYSSTVFIFEHSKYVHQEFSYKDHSQKRSLNHQILQFLHFWNSIKVMKFWIRLLFTYMLNHLLTCRASGHLVQTMTLFSNFNFKPNWFVQFVANCYHWP